MKNLGGGECNSLALIPNTVLCMYTMNGYKMTNINCNQTLNDNKIHHWLQKRRTKIMGVMTPQDRKDHCGLFPQGPPLI
jgi:hypothetical protein